MLKWSDRPLGRHLINQRQKTAVSASGWVCLCVSAKDRGACSVMCWKLFVLKLRTNTTASTQGEPQMREFGARSSRVCKKLIKIWQIQGTYKPWQLNRKHDCICVSASEYASRLAEDGLQTEKGKQWSLYIWKYTWKSRTNWLHISSFFVQTF